LLSSEQHGSRLSNTAQTLLGAVVGDEGTLNLPVRPSRIFRIVEIKQGT
jgi:transcription elongation GreA/GreB family factor